MGLFSSSGVGFQIFGDPQVGTGSGPTLEFYAQVSEHLRSSCIPGVGMPQPRCQPPRWLLISWGRRSRDPKVGQALASWVEDHPNAYKFYVGKKHEQFC